jgi:hypothetical protein
LHAGFQLHIDQHGLRVAGPIHGERQADAVMQRQRQIVIHGPEHVGAARGGQMLAGRHGQAHVEIARRVIQQPGLVGRV